MKTTRQPASAVSVCCLLLSMGWTLCLPASAAEQDEREILNAVLLYASFDEAVRGDFGVGRLFLETRSGSPGEPAQHIFQQGYAQHAYCVDKSAGVVGGALRCTDVLPESGRMYFPGDGHLAFRRGGWGGSFQFWLNTNPDQLLKTSFCDPIQITAKSAHDGGLWIDFPDDLPRSMRAGMFSALGSGEKPIPESAPDAPLIRVPEIGFKQGQWHHVVLTWENFDTGRADASAILYLDGQPVGTRTSANIALGWDIDRVGIYLAVNYIGLLDEFATFDRMLTADEVSLLHRQPNLLQRHLRRNSQDVSPDFRELRRQVKLLRTTEPPSQPKLRSKIISLFSTPAGQRELPALLSLLCQFPPQQKQVAAPKFPFTAEAAVDYQQLYAESSGLPLEVTNHLGMKFRLIPPGNFLMGSPADEPGHGAEGYDERQHEVSLTKPYYLATSETTATQFRQFVEALDYVTDVEHAGGGNTHNELAEWKHRPGTRWTKPGYAGPFALHDDQPVVHVSLTDARRFCRWLADAGTSDDPTEATYDLPTEAQWEWAARAGSADRFWWGNNLDTTGKVANVGDRALLAIHPQWPRKTMPMNDGHAYIAPVASFRANGYGLHDMLGNVWEFCSSRYVEYPQSPVVDPAPANPARGYAVRGGGWSNIPDHCRSASRNADPPHFGHSNLGFRVAILLPAGESCKED